MGAIKNLILGNGSDKKKKKQVSTNKQNSTLLNESKLPKATKNNKPVSSAKKTTSQQKNYSTLQDRKKSAVTTTKKALNQTQKALDKQTTITRREVSNRGITPGNNTFSAPNMFTQRNKIISDSRTGKAPVLNRNNNANAVINREKSEAKNVKKYQSYATSNEGQKQIAKTQEAKDYRNIARSNYETAKADYDYANASPVGRTAMKIAAPIRGGFSAIFKSDNNISGKTANKVYGLDANATSVRLPNYTETMQRNISENSSGLGKLYNDVGFSVGKRATLGALNNLVPGLGTAANAVNDVEESYNDAILQGKKHSQAANYSIGQSALNYAFDKFGSGKTSGMKSEGTLEKMSNKALGKIKPLLNKVIGESKSATITDYISTMGAEGAEEFIQSFFDKMNANLTLDNEEYIFSKESIKDAFYQGLGGILGAGLIGSGRLIHNSNSKNINNLMLETQSNLDKVVKKVEESGTELNDAQKEMIATTIISRALRAENGEADKITDEALDRLSDTIINSTNNAETQQTAEQNIQTAPTNQDSVRANIEQTAQSEQNVRQETEPQKSLLSEDEANELKTLEDLPFDLDDSQEKRLNYLKAKQEGRIKYADLKTNNEYEDIKKDYNKYRNTEDFDASTLNAAKDFVPGYKNTERRTKQEWLEVARMVGSNLDAKNSEELTKYALQSWHATKPNQKDNLNRQGKKFVDFKVSDWVNEVYKGAGVGQETQARPIQTNIENTDAIEYNKTGVDINERNQIADENSRNEFRKLQEESRRLSKDQHELLYRGDKSGIKRVRENISRVLQPKLESVFSSNNDSRKSVRNGFAEVKNTDFQEIFELNHPYLRNPDTVSVYGAEDYKNNRNYLSEDGLSGFSITPSGDLISVFNNSGKPGMLQRISDIVRAEAKTLDCFSSKAQDLPSLYQDAFGLKVASIMDFNYDIMAEEHGKEYADAFVEKYGEAPVYFMVKSDKNVTPKHFNKNQYDEATNYRDSFIEDEGTSDSSFSNEKTKANSDMPNNTLMVKYEKGTEVKPTKPLSEDEKVAQILSEKPVQKQTIKEKAQATKEKTMRELVDKGYAFRRYENKEVYHKYDQILTASGSANYCLGEAQVDLEGNEIGKSLKDIWAPIEKAGKVEEFDLYYYNLLNIDRYQQGKPVFGENWTDEDSRNLVSELESKNPEFKEWAKDVQTYQHNLSQNLVDAGLLSKELKEQFDTQNEYYAKIIRVNSKNKAAMTQNMKGINISNTIRTAKGGNQDIMPLMYSMAQQTMEVFDSARWNDFGQELLKTKGGIAEGETLNVDTDEGTTLSTNKNGEDTRVVKDGDTYKMYVYQNGEKVAVELSEAEYEGLAKSKFNDPQNFIFSAIRNVNGVYRGLLTDKNPLFLFTNFFRDIGDAPFNSKYSGQFVGGYAEAIKQMSSNSELWKKYKGLGGVSNSYFDTQKGIDLSKDNTAKKALGAIEKMNMYVEQAPRFAEFLLTLKNGGTESEAMYNAAEVTTNFKRGGDLTKTLNRNGAIFLNASVQGFSKVVRNFTENGAKGATQMLAKACILGVLPSVLNQLSYDDDDDYNDLPDYIKDNYYVFKTDDKKFIRIPKGRAMAVFGMAAQRTINYLKGDKDAFKGLLKNASNNIAPNNPLENNMISPILAVKNNVSWNGSPIVSEYLKNDTYPEYEYDAKTDSLSKAIGKFFGVSPKKVNYLLDQYSGGVGDVLLPLITPQAHVNPISAKFTTNTINSNKNIDKFYTELNSYSDKKRAGLSKDEDQVKYAYLNAVNGDIAELKGQLKEIQADTSLDNKTKLNKVNKIQQEINDRCKFALQDYETGYIESGSYAYVGEKEFYKDSSGSWHKVSADQQRSYNKYAAKYDITPGEYFSKAKITNDVIAGDKYEEYRNGVENARAKVEGTANKKAATIEYVNNLELDIPQKAMLIRSYYSSFKSYDSDIINYLNENVEDERQRYLIEIQLGIIRK